MTPKERVKWFFGLFKLDNLIYEIKRLGYSISSKLILFVLFILIVISFIAGYLLRMEVRFLVFLFICLFMCLPNVILAKYRHLREVDRFNEVVGYMEKLIYAFHKNGKIRESLIDVLQVSDKTVKARVTRMIEIIDCDMSTSKLYQKAFAVMQKEYDCTRLKILHDYLLAVEENGGNSGLSLNILLEDIRSWSERVLSYQADRKNVQVKAVISILCSLLTCGIMVNMVPDNFSGQMIHNSLYQWGTFVVLLLNIGIFLLSNNKISMSYLDNELDRKYSSSIRRQARYLANYANVNHLKATLIKLFMLAPLLGISLYKKFTVSASMVMFIMLYIALHDMLYRNLCVKNLTREVKKCFPIWLRALLLHLQTDNVHVAIMKSYDHCPEMLKPELESFIRDLENDPVTMQPYLNFLSEYPVPDLKLAVHYLYSVAMFGSEDVLTQLDYIIKQNSRLEVTEEKLRNDDSLAGFSTIILAPMLLAVLKLIIDLMLFLQAFMGFLSGSMV